MTTRMRNEGDNFVREEEKSHELELTNEIYFH
jgi:hypothetical protein